mgnify:CR=1 FL=1
MPVIVLSESGNLALISTSSLASSGRYSPTLNPDGAVANYNIYKFLNSSIIQFYDSSLENGLVRFNLRAGALAPAQILVELKEEQDPRHCEAA